MGSVNSTPRAETAQGAREAERREVERAAYVATFAALVAAGARNDIAAAEAKRAARVCAEAWKLQGKQ